MFSLLEKIWRVFRVSYPLYFVAKDIIENNSDKGNKVLYILRNAKSS
jgi:hypothetical protein